MKGERVWLDRTQARTLIGQFQETSRSRGWRLIAIAILVNHVHIVVGVPGDPDPSAALSDLKAYGSRALSRRHGRRRWWTESGSRRRLVDEPAVITATRYVRDQRSPLATWVDPEFAALAREGEASGRPDPGRQPHDPPRSATQPAQPAHAGRSPDPRAYRRCINEMMYAASSSAEVTRSASQASVPRA
ncbi:MAG: hypothetical protein FJZ92_06150 [Chloroflexi bacterium]|nr:hypothetical protein [Chloroflexota bacterium]